MVGVFEGGSYKLNAQMGWALAERMRDMGAELADPPASGTGLCEHAARYVAQHLRIPNPTPISDVCSCSRTTLEQRFRIGLNLEWSGSNITRVIMLQLPRH